jgi:hypothetical protein
MPQTAAPSPATTFTSSSSLQPSSPSSLPTLDDVLERIALAKTIAKEGDKLLKEAMADLDALVDAGEVDPTEPLIWDDIKISSSTRKSYVYPDHILQQQTDLKAAQELAVALGEAETKLTTFWTVRSL